MKRVTIEGNDKTEVMKMENNTEMNWFEDVEGKKNEGSWKGGVAAFLAFGWLAFLVGWLLTFAGDFDIYKNIAVGLGSLALTLLAIMGVLMWGFGKYMKAGAEMMKEVKGLSWRMGLSMNLVPITVIALVGWLWFFAADYSSYENLAAVVVIIVGAIAIMGVTWKTFNAEKAFGLPEGEEFDFHAMCAEVMAEVDGLEGEVAECPFGSPA
jgi:hypothetical protein